MGTLVAQASAFSQNYCGYPVPVGAACGHGNYNSIIYNRGETSGTFNNNCVYMVTAAGNFRGNAIVCASGGSNIARMCVSSPTPMSQGVTYPVETQTFIYAVVNNLTFDSGCAV